MSEVNPGTEQEIAPFMGTQQITSAPTADGSLASVEDTPLPPVVQEQAETGEGINGEQEVWEGRYSLKNFIGRILWRVVATGAYLPFTIISWNKVRDDVAFFAILIGIALVCFWVKLFYNILSASLGHHYRLTNRRLFITSGLFRSQQNQMELAQVKDISIRQSFVEGWFSVGTVEVIPMGHELPIFNIAGVSEPGTVMDQVWHHARLERERLATVQA